MQFLLATLTTFIQRTSLKYNNITCGLVFFMSSGQFDISRMPEGNFIAFGSRAKPKHKQTSPTMVLFTYLFTCLHCWVLLILPRFVCLFVLRQ